MLTMSTRGPSVTQNFRIVLQILRAGRSSRFESNYGRSHKQSLIMSESKLGSGYWMRPGVQFFSTNGSVGSDSNGVKNVKVQPPVPSSPSFTFTKWLRWVLGSVVSLLLPCWSQWQKLQRIEGEAEMVVEEVEKVANVVEKVATVTEKVAKDVAENLPEDCQLKKAALVVEHVSEEAAHDAHLTQEFIHKVDEVKNDLDDLESFVEPIIDKIAKKESERK